MQHEPFKLTITRSKRKTLVIYIRDDGVEVRAPLMAPQNWIDEFVELKKPWILKKLKLQQQKNSERLKLEEGETILYCGKLYELKLSQGKNQISLEQDKLYIRSRQLEEGYLKKQFQQWLLQQAKENFEPRVWQIASVMGLDDKVQEVKFRKTKTKWGHCTTKGALQFNPLLMMAPASVRDYLIIHELCHLKYMNHSKSFWQLVEANCPDYQESEQWLKQHGHRVWC
ncbi:M48 family metallopeptidase [Kangiella sp.]|uniref:M48 family metallopeptidase n=1 Tax=Kangiella sp. TaxID=1920245 RepID=UPI0019CA2AA6|nr:SprT family zinc-dependent metalloprotease [Kangiella sp.]MBD3652762.1 M48 family metallopeptidase [Kangiella sp.]